MFKFTPALVCGVVLVGTVPLADTAFADNAEILEAECHKQLNLGDSSCACIADRAKNSLNENQQELVVAMVTKNQAASAALRDQMTVEEISGAAKFMMEAPQTCAGQQ